MLTVMPPRALIILAEALQVDQHVVVDLEARAPRRPTASARRRRGCRSGPRTFFGTAARHVVVHRVEEVLGVVAVAVGEPVRVVLVQRRVRPGTASVPVLRGRLNSVVSPVLVSMLARITVSVRVPVRSGPASPPSSRMFSRGLSAHGSGASARSWSACGVQGRPGRALGVLVALEHGVHQAGLVVAVAGGDRHRRGDREGEHADQDRRRSTRCARSGRPRRRGGWRRSRRPRRSATTISATSSDAAAVGSDADRGRLWRSTAAQMPSDQQAR